MRHTTFFLIEPKVLALREFPIRAGADSITLLLDALLTSRNHVDRSKWRESDIELAVKLLYVARLREYTPFADDEAAKKIFGSDRISVDVFDQWWSIRRLALDEGPSEDMEDYLVALNDKFQPIGNELVDDWVRGLSD